jgi:hypothetical protein
MSDDGAGAPAAAEAAKKHKHVPNPRRRAKLKQAAAADDAQQLPPEERKRRAEQRRRREIALNVRAAGKTYNPHKLRKAQGGGAGGGDAAGGGVKKVKRADRVKLKAGKAHRCSHHVSVPAFIVRASCCAGFSPGLRTVGSLAVLGGRPLSD